MPRIRVIGCGNPDAGDDVLGLLVARAVRAHLPDDVEVIQARSPTRVVDLLQDADAVIVVDAIWSPQPSEGIRRIDVTDPRAPGFRTSLSSHGLGLVEACALVASVGPLPRVVVLGVDVQDVEMGAPPSPDVAAAVGELVDAVVAEVAALSSVGVP